ncbi:Thioredoxin reductase [Microbacterium hydrothermale]|uniref:NAD(P)-binding domain-containing protein n=1 Tax=Microbacterium hydrothermale TaxID=857427 RepID=UPI002225BF37|nr:NAD(P)-binding domain-containing protein [Microbacterium hydrothermale]MCW2163095.1 Thioredoxin reductase [Microbacterium hydrothermale]
MSTLTLTPRPRVTDRLATLPVAIIGAGPVGLAAAAHLADRGIAFTVLEAASGPAAAVEKWGHTRLFSAWREVVDPVARRLLEATGWTMPAEGRAPTGSELVDAYLRPLAELPEIAVHIRYGARVTGIAREGMDRTRSADRENTPFLVRTPKGELLARAVLDASGTYDSPNSLLSTGLPTIDDPRISHALPDVLGRERDRFAGRHTVVVGAGHSAANTLISLVRLQRDAPGTRITWLIRNAGAVRVSSSADDELVGRAQLGARVDRYVEAGAVEKIDSFEIGGVEALPDGIRLLGRRRGELDAVTADVVVNATGFRPDLAPLREIRTDLDAVVEAPRLLAPLIDPNVHSCGTVEPHGFRELMHPEHGFFVVGMKSYGRAPTFLLATGYEQVRSIAAWLAGDLASASRVELSLPATGVCSTDAGGCC